MDNSYVGVVFAVRINETFPYIIRILGICNIFIRVEKSTQF